MKYMCLISVMMLMSCMSTKQIKPVKPLVIQQDNTVSVAEPLRVDSVVSDQVNVETPANVFGVLVLMVLLTCAACGVIPGLIHRFRKKDQTARSNEHVVSNDSQ